MIWLEIDATLSTAGDGHWSRERRDVKHRRARLHFYEADHGELCVYFSRKDWHTRRHGFIYTDSKWIVDLRDRLIQIGFTREAADDVNYSEQGMQGRDYVSLDVGAVFLAECLTKYEKKTIR